MAGALDLRRVVKRSGFLSSRKLEGRLPRLTQATEVRDLNCWGREWTPYPNSAVTPDRIIPVAGVHDKGEADAARALDLQPTPPSGENGRSLAQKARMHELLPIPSFNFMVISVNIISTTRNLSTTHTNYGILGKLVCKSIQHRMDSGLSVS